MSKESEMRQQPTTKEISSDHVAWGGALEKSHSCPAKKSSEVGVMVNSRFLSHLLFSWVANIHTVII